MSAPERVALRAVFVPQLAELAQNPYWVLLRRGLEEEGVQFADEAVERFTLRSLWRRRNQPLVYHFHYIQHFYAYEGRTARLRWVLRFGRNLALARAWGHGLVFTLHNLTPTYPLEPLWVDRLGHRLMIALADRVIVHCERARALLAATYGRRRAVDVVAHPHFIGVYPDGMSDATARASFGFGPDDVVLAFVGGLRPNKGLATLLRTFRRTTDPRLRLLIAGQPGQSATLLDELRAAAGDDPRIRLHAARVADDELQRFLRAADAVVLPFARILTSGSAMLALSYGRPLVVPRLGCLEELPGDVAVTYPPGDDVAFLAALNGLAERDLAAMGARARVYAGRFSPAEFARSTLSVYVRAKSGDARPQPRGTTIP